MTKEAWVNARQLEEERLDKNKILFLEESRAGHEGESFKNDKGGVYRGGSRH